MKSYGREKAQGASMSSTSKETFGGTLQFVSYTFKESLKYIVQRWLNRAEVVSEYLPMFVRFRSREAELKSAIPELMDMHHLNSLLTPNFPDFVTFGRNIPISIAQIPVPVPRSRIL
jgi:hypothetical protein